MRELVVDKQPLPSSSKKPWAIEIVKAHPNNALMQFLAQAQREIQTNDQSPLKKIVGPRDGFIARLTQFRAYI